MPRKGRRGRRGRGGENNQQLVDHMTFSTMVGSSAVVHRANITIIPGTRAFKITHAFAEVAGAHWYDPPRGTASASIPAAGGWIPAFCQLRIYDPKGLKAVATSGAHMVGPSPRRVSVRNNPGADWVGMDAAPNIVLIAIDSGCMTKNAPGNAYITGVLHIFIRIQQEETQEACPTLSSLQEKEVVTSFEVLSGENFPILK